jgi:large subunit ribosomal protein L10
MERHEKDQIISELKQLFQEYTSFYLTDTTALNSKQTGDLRRALFQSNIKMQVAKNTLIEKALEQSGLDVAEMYSVLKGNTAIMFSNDAKSPAKIIKEFRKNGKIPALKAAWAEQTVFIGDNQLAELEKIKSKNELIGDIVGLLQSPAKKVISGLQSGGNKLSSILKALEDRAA